MRFSNAVLTLVCLGSAHTAYGFAMVRNNRCSSSTVRSRYSSASSDSSRLFVAEMDKVEDAIAVEYIPSSLKIKSIGTEEGKTEVLDPRMYESALIQQWDANKDKASGFDWEMEKMRRYFAGLRMREDGTWVKRPGPLDFLISSVSVEASSVAPGSRKDQPRPVTAKTIVKLFTYNILSSLGLGPLLGMSAVPDAVIQKYEGSFLSFITGVLGGDLQTLAGGPLFLLLAKYYKDYGPIFNLSFGPKSFLVVSDPVMAKHILKSSPDAYCKGMLADILEPIMGKGLIPADPETWKVSNV